MVIDIGGAKILVDPILSAKGSLPPIQNSPNPLPNPLVGLPVDVSSLTKVDAILVTHTHRDHFDDAAARRLPKDLPVFCQPEDEAKLIGLGFGQARAFDRQTWRGITFVRTGGHHGTGVIGEKMGAVSGAVLTADGEPSLYITGDTIWCREVEEVLERHQPDVTIVFAGAAQFLEGDPITMNAADVCRVCRKVPNTKVVTVHMESFNHCLLTRRRLADILAEERLSGQVMIPADGEQIEF
jgi:L-ascorbate metabolism protein UlaG (beta-lactamase superfamily)